MVIDNSAEDFKKATFGFLEIKKPTPERNTAETTAAAVKCITIGDNLPIEQMMVNENSTMATVTGVTENGYCVSVDNSGATTPISTTEAAVAITPAVNVNTTTTTTDDTSYYSGTFEDIIKADEQEHYNGTTFEDIIQAEEQLSNFTMTSITTNNNAGVEINNRSIADNEEILNELPKTPRMMYCGNDESNNEMGKCKSELFVRKRENSSSTTCIEESINVGVRRHSTTETSSSAITAPTSTTERKSVSMTPTTGTLSTATTTSTLDNIPRFFVGENVLVAPTESTIIGKF